tara:strand:- start:1006 stop:1272 length:267 start_codon:yes stop_codon:yes gene_type:complete
VENNMDLEEEIAMLKEENAKLKNDKDCADEELKTLEGLLRIFSNDNKLPEEGMDCHGCRIRQIGYFIAFTIDTIKKERGTVVQATPIK